MTDEGYQTPQEQIQFIPFKVPTLSSCMKDETEQVGTKCANCDDELEYAAYALGVQEGVIGGTGFVATHLHDWLLFCSNKCLVSYMKENGEGETYQRVQPRIP